MNNESIQRRLFNDSALATFENACSSALTMETTKSDMEIIHSGAAHFIGKGSFQGHNNNTAQKYKQEARPQYKSNTSNGDHGQRSNSGYRSTFSPGDRRVVCFVCGHAGHIARYCDRRKQQNNGKSSNFNKDKSRNRSTVHNLQENSSFDFQYLNSLQSLYINRLNSSALTTLVNINGKEVRMEIDTGASGTVIHIDHLKELFPELKLGDSSRNFKLLTGESVDVVGSAYVSVTHNKRKFDVEITVVNATTGVLPLFGQDWLDLFYSGWRDFFLAFQEAEKVHKIQEFDVNKLKNEICAKYKSVFSGDMFKPIKDFEAEIVLVPDAPPIFCKPYSVPYGIRDKVEEDLKRLVDVGILIPVKHSKRASPIVVVKKQNGDIRICVDGKRTLNRYIETEHYPLPVIDDILADMSDSKVFCVLDLTGAYQQLAVSKRSQELLTINTHIGLFQFTRLVFGVASAPAIFQCEMDEILKGIPNVKCYFDDVCCSEA